MRPPKQTRPSGFDLQMTAMIDVVFLLLVFFLWTSSFDEPEFDLISALSLPPAGNLSETTETKPVMFDEIVVRILKDSSGSPKIRLNGNSIETLDALNMRLQAIRSVGAQPSVIIDPESAVEMETAIAVYDVARKSGFDRVLFTVSQ